VVETRAAAANPALSRLRLAITAAGVRVSGAPGGTAVAVGGSGATVFHSDPATMWDSSPATTGPAREADPAMAAGLANGQHTARFAVAVSGSAETLVPDRSMLTAASTHYPVYIDPNWSGSPSQLHWARISSNGWDIIDSTSTAKSDHPRDGFDGCVQDGGQNEVARAYYQMDTGGSTGTSGIGGAVVTAATLSIQDLWAADSARTPVDVHLACQPVGNRWDSADLHWSNKPCEGVLQDEQNSYETSSGTVSPTILNFNVLGAAQAAARAPWPNITFEVRAPDEGNELEWKQFASGGGASISITYMRRPDFAGGTGNPTITPSATDSGTTFATSPTPTLNITAEDTDGENVQTSYQVWQGSSSSPATMVAQGTGPSSGYAVNGGPWRVGSSLPDGVYEWRASATNPISSSNPQGLWTGGRRGMCSRWTPARLTLPPSSRPSSPPASTGRRSAHPARSPSATTRPTTSRGICSLSTATSAPPGTTPRTRHPPGPDPGRRYLARSTGWRPTTV
jgi:hypothetical protein